MSTIKIESDIFNKQTGSEQVATNHICIYSQSREQSASHVTIFIRNWKKRFPSNHAILE
jgi:hypothetical protein